MLSDGQGIRAWTQRKDVYTKTARCRDGRKRDTNRGSAVAGMAVVSGGVRSLGVDIQVTIASCAFSLSTCTHRSVAGVDALQ